MSIKILRIEVQLRCKDTRSRKSWTQRRGWERKEKKGCVRGSARACRSRGRWGKIRFNEIFRPHCSRFAQGRIKLVGWRKAKRLIWGEPPDFLNFCVREDIFFIRFYADFGSCGWICLFVPHRDWGAGGQLLFLWFYQVLFVCSDSTLINVLW